MDEIILYVTSHDAFFAEQHAAARRIDGGDDTPTTPRIAFPTIDDLWRFMTPERWALLKTLQKLGPTPDEALSKALRRDAGALAEDVAKLREIGLVEADQKDRLFVPWAKITAEVSVANAA